MPTPGKSYPDQGDSFESFEEPSGQDDSVPVPTPARGRSTGLQWSSTERTREVFLETARAVFGERGFAEASVAEVVERAGASVGSLYHHFGGKSELFLAVWDDHRLHQQELAAQAVAEARKSGETDPFTLFLIGSRAFLEATWSSRDLIAMFMDGDTPPGFHHVQRQASNSWIEKNFRLLRAENQPVNRVIVFLLTSFTGEARREIAAAHDEHEAQQLVDAMIGILAKLRPILTDDIGLDHLPNPG